MSRYTKLPPSALQCNICDLVLGGFLYPVREMKEHIRENHPIEQPTVWDTIQEPEPQADDWREYREPIALWRSRATSGGDPE